MAGVFRGAAFFVLEHGAPAEDGADARRELNTVLFGSLDGGRSVFASAGVKRTLGGSLDRDGFVLMGGAGAGGAPERGPLFGGSTFQPTAQAHAMLGYQWMLGTVAISALAGPELDAELDAPDAWRSARARFGLRGHAELWAHPTPQTLATATPPARRASIFGAGSQAAMPSGRAFSSGRRRRSTRATTTANGASARI